MLAAHSTSKPIQDAATRLGQITGAYVGMLNAVGVAVDVVENWEGCPEAELLMAWITDDATTKEESWARATQMDKWASTYWHASADLAKGKVPA